MTPTTPRAYTLAEIDRMRHAVRVLNTPIFPNGAIIHGDPWKEAAERSENRLRTYMLGGVSPEELEAKATETCLTCFTC